MTSPQDKLIKTVNIVDSVKLSDRDNVAKSKAKRRETSNDANTFMAIERSFKKHYMQLALAEAQKAYAEDEIPVGCVIVQHSNGVVIASAHNLSEQGRNPNLHAEIIAINEACKKIDSKSLADCDIYVSLEPCVMCASAIANARIKRLYYAAADPKQGAVENGIRFYTSKSCFHRPEIYPGLLSSESEATMASFFSKLRKNKL
ncbi:MAG: hypothetical protein Tsb006_6960 [Rickettsiaceae bacterium]